LKRQWSMPGAGWRDSTVGITRRLLPLGEASVPADRGQDGLPLLKRRRGGRTAARRQHTPWVSYHVIANGYRVPWVRVLPWSAGTADVETWNVSACHRGMMGGSTPNIDRIAKEGALFTDCYGQQSCTAGQAAFITG